MAQRSGTTGDAPTAGVGQTSYAGRPKSPTDRYGGWMWGVWLVFLFFPMATVWTAPLSRPLQLLGTALIVVFGVYYVRITNQIKAGPTDGRGERSMVVLCLFPVALAMIVGTGAISLLPFLASFTAFGVRRPANWFVLAGVVIWGLGWLALSGDYQGGIWFLLILIAVSVGTAVGRIEADHAEEMTRTREQLAVTGERERVARDVHDVLGHSLTVVTIKAELAEKLIDVDPERARAELAEVQRLSRQALAEIRATVGGLRATRIMTEVETARAALAGAGVEAELPDDVSVVDPTHRTVIAWALREAVTNVVRHAHASRCVVELTNNGLVVSDNGRGMRARRFGNGLNGLAERIEQAGGTLMIDKGSDGVGTRMEVRLS